MEREKAFHDYRDTMRLALTDVDDPLDSLEDERFILSQMKEDGADAEVLGEIIEKESPACVTPGLSPEKATAYLIEEGEDPYADTYVTYKDIYCRIMNGYEEALIRKRGGASVDDQREYYNTLAARELREKYGATDEEIRVILGEIGGIRENEDKDAYMNRVLEKAKEKEEEDEPIATKEAAAEVVVRKVEQEREEAAEEDKAHWKEQERDQPVRRIESHLTRAGILEARKKVHDYRFPDDFSKGKDADEAYRDCAEKIQEDLGIPLDTQMDEQIILHMFETGYEADQIENALQHQSPVPFKTSAHGKKAVNRVLKTHANDIKARLEVTMEKAENKYQQTKLRSGKTMTDYDRARTLVRDTNEVS